MSDTTAAHQLFITFRHTDRYPYNNLWVQLVATAPGAVPDTIRLDLPLATNDGGWNGTGMDDLWDHRIAVQLDPDVFNFNRAGLYRFELQQIMRDDPLPHVFNAGIRLERAQAPKD